MLLYSMFGLWNNELLQHMKFKIFSCTNAITLCPNFIRLGLLYQCVTSPLETTTLFFFCENLFPCDVGFIVYIGQRRGNSG